MKSFPSDVLDFKQLLVRILGNERRVQVEFLIALAEFDRCELFLELGYSTLWDFCMKELHLCKGSTFRRTHSVAMIQRFPQHAKLSDRVMNKLRRARELASHAIPGGEWEDVLEAALDCFIAEQEKRRAAKTNRPRKTSKPPKDPNYISAEVRRIVWERDGGACTWHGPDGHVCRSTWQVEFDHIDPDGPSTSDNLRLLCRNHNRLHAEHCYGKAHMAQFRRKPGSAGGTRVTEVTSERMNCERASREEQATETQPRGEKMCATSSVSFDARSGPSSGPSTPAVRA